MGEEWKNALASYRLDGSEWSLSFPAESFEDAQRRVRAIRGNLSLDGWPSYAVPAVPAAGFFVRLLCWLGNIFRAKEDR